MTPMARDTEKPLGRTAAFWSQRDSYAAPTYYRFGPVIDRYARKVFGVPAGGRADWLEHLLATVTLRGEIPFGRVLSLCCGFGHVERALARENFGTDILGVDVSPAALEEAARLAREEGLTGLRYERRDVNRLSLEEGEWDVVYASGGLHHLENVDAVLGTVARGIRQGGYFIAFERIGPRYAEPSPGEMEVLNAVMHVLPPEFRPQFKIKGEGTLRGVLEDAVKGVVNGLNRRRSRGRVFFPPPPLYWKLFEPSEGIGSHRILDAVRREFPRGRVFPLNGGLLAYLVGAGFLASYDGSDPAHVRLLESLFLLEDALTEMGRIRCVDAVFLCRKE